MKKDNNSSIWSWKLTPNEIEEQVWNYKKLKITQSQRFLAVVVVVAFFVFDIAWSSFFNDSNLLNVLVVYWLFLPFLIFTYFGHRWAMVCFMLLFSCAMLMDLWNRLAETNKISFTTLFIWFTVLPIFWKALSVENLRHKK